MLNYQHTDASLAGFSHRISVVVLLINAHSHLAILFAKHQLGFMTSLNTIPFSLLELSSMRQDEHFADTLKKSTQYAQHADQLGFHRFWFAEHHNMQGIASSATAVLIGHVANHTEHLRVGSGGIMLPNHAPLVVAEQFGTLDSLHPNRIDLGLGRAPGSDASTSQALNRDPSRADRFEQEVTELQTLLGPHQAGKSVRAYPGENSQVPIWLLGSSLFSAKLAAKKGLPYAFAGHFAPRYVYQAVDVYRQHFTPSEHLSKPYVMVALPLVAAQTDQQAQYLSSTQKQRILALLRGEGLWLKPPVDSMQGLWTEQERAFVDDFLSLNICGGPISIRHKLEQLVNTLAIDELMFTNDMYHHQDRLTALDILAEIKQ